MKFDEAAEKIEREQPDLKGDARLWAIKALLDADKAPKTAAKKEQRNAKQQAWQADWSATPTWKKALAAIAFFEWASAISALVYVAAPYHLHGAARIGYIALWPSLLHPPIVGVIAAIVAGVLANWAASTKRRQRRQRPV